MDAIVARAKKFFEERNFVVLDTETTGLDTSIAEIVNIAILDANGMVLLDTLVRPEKPIPPGMIHGITDEMVRDAPTFPEIFPRIMELLKGANVVAYNANYDIGLIESLAYRHKLGDLRCNSVWCLMKRYAAYRKTPGRYGNYKWHKLSEACAQQRVVLGNAHRALGDAQATYALLKALSEKE